MESNMKKIEISTMYAELLIMKKMIASLKEDFDDRFLTAEEEILVEQAKEEYKQGKIISFDDLRKQLNV